MTDTLLGLISNHGRVKSIADFAELVKVGRSSVYRWGNSMPTPEILRRVANALDEPYGVVLAAALRSGGYIDTTSDMLEGLQVHVVNHGYAAHEEWPVPVVAYAEKAYAEKLVEDAMFAYRGQYEQSAVVIASAPPRPAEKYYARFERGVETSPKNLAKCVLSHRSAIGPDAFPSIPEEELKATGAINEPFIVMRNGYVMRVETSAFDEKAAKLVVERTLWVLSDRLSPVGADFGTVKDLAPIKGSLPAAVAARGDFHGEPWFSITIADLLSPEEISAAATAYRAARAVNAQAAEAVQAFEVRFEYESRKDTATDDGPPGTQHPAAVPRVAPVVVDHAELGRGGIARSALQTNPESASRIDFTAKMLAWLV